MYLIRNVARVQMGRRDEAVGLLKEMGDEMAKALGFPRGRVLTGSIGPSDSTVVFEAEWSTLGDFEAGLARVNEWAEMGAFMKRMVEVVVPGTNRWEIYRIA